MMGVMYSVRQIGPHAFQMAKWDDEKSSKLPADIYTIRGNYCDCPAHVPWCKHKEILKKFQSQPSMLGVYYDADRDRFHVLAGFEQNERALVCLPGM